MRSINLLTTSMLQALFFILLQRPVNAIMDMAKKMAKSCQWPEIHFCPAANGMCFRPDQYCDSDHGRVVDCFDRNESNASRILFCKEHKGNLSALNHPQCHGACDYLFPDLSVEISAWECNYWCTTAIVFIILSVLLIGTLVTVVCSFLRKVKQSQPGHMYSPITGTETGSDVKPHVQRQLSKEDQKGCNDVEAAAAGGDTSCGILVNLGQNGTELQEISIPHRSNNVSNQNQKEGRVSPNPRPASFQSDLSEGSNGSVPSQANTGQSRSAYSAATPPASTGLTNQMPVTCTNSSENLVHVVTNQTEYKPNQRH